MKYTNCQGFDSQERPLKKLFSSYSVIVTSTDFEWSCIPVSLKTCQFSTNTVKKFETGHLVDSVNHKKTCVRRKPNYHF